jgi:microcystin degradation protein MlrC
MEVITMNAPRVLIAGLFHETHTFLDDVTPLEQFQFTRGKDFLSCEGDGSPLGGALEAAAKLDWDLIPTVDCRAQPSGTAADEVFEAFWADLRPQVEQAVASGIDAIYLVLHGAMVTQSVRDVEGELLQRLRQMSGVESLPIFGVFDLHANFSQAMADHADCLVAYRHNPHTDACAMAMHAAELLSDHLARRTGLQTRPDGSGDPSYAARPRTYWRHAGIIWPPTGTGTADTPMFELEALARKLEIENDVLSVNVVGGFSFADTPDTGVSFTVVTRGDEAQAQSLLDQFCQLAWDLREAGNKVDPSLDKVMHDLRSSELNRGLIVVVEPSDNIGGGAPGDGTGLLRALVANDIQNSAVCLCDPQAVAALQHVQLGERVTLPLGGKGSRLDEGPLPLEVELVSRSDGHFALEDRQSHLATMYGDRFNMGPCAVVRHRGITILLTSIKTPPFDLGQWRSQGIEPAKLAVIGVKAAVAHRRAYDPIAARMLWVDTPGPCRSDLRKLPYQHVRRPVYPLDL